VDTDLEELESAHTKAAARPRLDQAWADGKSAVDSQTKESRRFHSAAKGGCCVMVSGDLETRDSRDSASAMAVRMDRLEMHR
jgi:hypothetical protein